MPHPRRSYTSLAVVQVRRPVREMRARQGDQVLAPAPGAPTLLPQSNPCRADPYTVAGAPLSAARLTRPCSSDPGAAPASRPLYLASHMPRRPSLGPSREIDDEHDEQNDDQKANQSVAGSSNGEHAEHGASLRFDCREVCLPLISFKRGTT